MATPHFPKRVETISDSGNCEKNITTKPELSPVEHTQRCQLPKPANKGSWKRVFIFYWLPAIMVVMAVLIFIMYNEYQRRVTENVYFEELQALKEKIRRMENEINIIKRSKKAGLFDYLYDIFRGWFYSATEPSEGSPYYQDKHPIEPSPRLKRLT